MADYILTYRDNPIKVNQTLSQSYLLYAIGNLWFAKFVMPWLFVDVISNLLPETYKPRVRSEKGKIIKTNSFWRLYGVKAAICFPLASERYFSIKITAKG